MIHLHEENVTLEPFNIYTQNVTNEKTDHLILAVQRA